MVEVEGRRIGGKKKRKRTHRARKKRNKKKTRKKNQQKLQGQDRGRPGIYSPRTILRLSPGSVGQIRLSDRNFRYGALPKT